jgi:hypothetical protein
MVHYGEAINRLGKLIDYSTIRFEAKHSYFKTAAKTAHNWINVPKTIARQHQIILANNLIYSNHINEKIIIKDLVISNFIKKFDY